MPDALSPFRIAILGPGRIGSAYAFHLVRDGHHSVTVIARPGSKRLRQLEHEGAIITAGGERAAVEVRSELDEAVDYDLVIVTVLAHQLHAVLPALRRISAKSVLFMVNMFDPEQMQVELGEGRCAFGMQFIQANLDDEGRLTTKIAAGQKIILSDQVWVNVFKAANLPAALEPGMTRWLRSHVPLCVAFESVCVAGARRGGGASWGEALAAARGMGESFRLIEKLGYDLYPASKKRLAQLPPTMVAIMLWSISRIRSFRDLLATAKDECCALVDTMVGTAPSARQPVSTSLIKGMKPL